MTIIEAIKLSEKTGAKYIHRTGEDPISQNCKYLPTDTPDCVLLVISPIESNGWQVKTYPRWNPTKEELLGDDWEPCD